MNERIRELADRACEYADYDPGYMPDEFLKKFALLIVRECASKVTRNEALNIFEHFGVGE